MQSSTRQKSYEHYILFHPDVFISYLPFAQETILIVEKNQSYFD